MRSSRDLPGTPSSLGTKVSVTANSRSRFADEADVLKSYTEEAIAKSGNLQIASPGDVNISIDLDKLDVRTRNASKVGSKSEKYKDKDGKTKYRDVPTTEYYTILTSDEKEYEYVAPSTSDVQERYLRDAAMKIASRIAPTHRSVKVLVPRGSFESLIPLAERGSWDQYLKGVEAVPVMRDAASEAYRQYALGVAKEALASCSLRVGRAERQPRSED